MPPDPYVDWTSFDGWSRRGPGAPHKGHVWLTAASLDDAGIGSNPRVLHSETVRRFLSKCNGFVG
jgi:hypothetical protein